MAGTVSSEQLSKLSYLNGEKSTIITTGIARLHTSNKADRKWLYTELCGAICLVIDRGLGGIPFFRMYDLNTFDMVFECELYLDFHNSYVEINDFFHCFEVPGEFFIGFSFADSNEAMKFRVCVQNYSPKSNKPVFTFKPQSTQVSEKPKEKKKKGFFASLFSKKEKKPKEGDERKLDSDDEDYFNSLAISQPHQLVHENHIGWDSKNNCFDFSQLSRETKKMFKNAGIRKKDLRDKDTALMIYATLLNPTVEQSTNVKGKQVKTAKAAKSRDKKPNSTTPNANAIPDLGAAQIQTNVPQLNIMTTSTEVMKPPSLSLNTMNVSKTSTSVTAKPSSLTQQQTTAPAKPTADRGALLEQIRQGAKLKPVTATNKTTVSVSKEQEVSMTSKLAVAIAERRKQLTANQVDSEEDDAWSDG